ncbi:MULTISPECIES: pyocin activator PrtN family protein [Paraburkholderia]|uniref:pyocin activator PrtN family protein n=1 Tax=Paraburkholderia TaxID=1822464 RepID=UPI00224E6895|nr:MULTISPECIES: pyocin activator PrtN family protein [Paraburkholderia]MCX4156172.1 pyocin activator PrtN family protein [Paraburkholderia aspalathi]MDN7165578.1 pyocin activator PrtN family protein [Paraburkholderia sp. SECH2]MDQ6394064.1 pyocin activator PrtN family protein [Paraburkholderia aspalathi]
MKSTLERLESLFNSPLIPVDVVRANFFPHLSVETFTRRARGNDFGFPVISSDSSQKAAMFVHIEDLATYLDSRRTVAVREHGYLVGARRPVLLEAPSPDDDILREHGQISKRKTV